MIANVLNGNAVKDIPMRQSPADTDTQIVRGGITSGIAGEPIRYANKWRENYNTLAGLTLARVRDLNVMTQRGDHAYPQLTYRTIERRHPTLAGLIDACQAPLANFKWDVRAKKELPDGFTEEQIEAQRAKLKSAYSGVDNIREAIGYLGHAFFRGFSVIQKQNKDDGGIHLECLYTWCICRDGLFGDWFWNPDSISLSLPERVLGESNRIGGESLPRTDFIVFEVERPIDEIALENYVRRKLCEKNWTAFDEIFGIPGGVVEMPPLTNVTPDQVSNYENSAKSIAEGGTGALPNGAKYYPNDQPRDGSNLFKTHISQLDEELVLAGTGGKLTMLVQSGQGEKRGSASTQENVFWEIMQKRGGQISEAFHRDFDVPFLSEAFPGQPPLVEFCLVTEDVVDVNGLVANAVALKGAGYDVDAEWLEQQTGYVLSESEEPKGTGASDNDGNDDVKNRILNGDVAGHEFHGNQYTIERYDRATSQMRSETYQKGEHVRVSLGTSSITGKIAHISQTNGTVRLEGSELRHKFGTVYKTEQPKPPVEKNKISTSEAIRRVNAKHEPEGGWSEKDRVPAQFKHAVHNREETVNSADLASTLHETLLPLLKRLDAIGKLDDAGIQQSMIEKLLKDFPQIAAALHADDSLAKKLSPLLTENLLKGLQGDALKNRDGILNYSDDQPRDDKGQFAETNELKSLGVKEVDLPRSKTLRRMTVDAVKKAKDAGFGVPESITSKNYGGRAIAYGSPTNGIGITTGRVNADVFARQVEAGHWSQENPVLHEIGHIEHSKSAGDVYDGYSTWSNPYGSKPIALKVSRYAATNPKEFVAETFAGHLSGKRYPADVMAHYELHKGPKLK